VRRFFLHERQRRFAAIRFQAAKSQRFTYGSAQTPNAQFIINDQ